MSTISARYLVFIYGCNKSFRVGLVFKNVVFSFNACFAGGEDLEGGGAWPGTES